MGGDFVARLAPASSRGSRLAPAASSHPPCDHDRRDRVRSYDA